MPCLAGEATATHLDAVQPWHEAFGFGLLHESAVFGGFALVRCREVGFEWNGQFHEVYCGVRVQDYDVRSPCRVAAEWQLVGASGEVDLDIAVWVLALDVREEVLQDAVVTPCVGPGVEEVLTMVPSRRSAGRQSRIQPSTSEGLRGSVGHRGRLLTRTAERQVAATTWCFSIGGLRPASRRAWTRPLGREVWRLCCGDRLADSS